MSHSKDGCTAISSLPSGMVFTVHLREFLTWSGGGHHASLLFAPDVPASVSLSSTGPMMGILRGANFPVNSCLIPPGARLLIFSDGVFEIWRDKHAGIGPPASAILRL
jgi:serine phosphatase RsbU (regulator of sigma subunit)